MTTMPMQLDVRGLRQHWHLNLGHLAKLAAAVLLVHSAQRALWCLAHQSHNVPAGHKHEDGVSTTLLLE